MIQLASALLAALYTAGFIPTARCPYVIRAEVVEAIEGGPVVVHVEVRRVDNIQPSEKLHSVNFERLVGNGITNSGYVSHPKSWGDRSFDGVLMGRMGGFAKLPEAGWQTDLFFQKYHLQSIPSGAESITISWPIFKNRTRIGTAATVLRVNVLPATAENLLAVRNRIEKRWHDAGLSAEKQDAVIALLYRASRPELVETALSLVRSPDLSPEAKGRTLVFNSWRTAPNLTHTTFAQLAREFRSSVAVDAFEMWCDKPALLPDAEFRSLYQSNRLWLRILTYAVFDARCATEWVAKLRQEVPGLCNSAPAQKVATILKDLDDSRFIVRRRARDELFDLGETAETPVRAALKQPLSSEVRSSLQLYLDRMENGVAPFLGKRAIELLESEAPAKGKEMLELLAQGDPTNFVTREAKRALREREELLKQSEQQKPGR